VWAGSLSGSPCVIKKLKATSAAAREDLVREAIQLAQIRPNPAVCAFYGVSLDGKFPCVALEYIAGGDLEKMLYERQTSIDARDVSRISMELASGMQFIHTQEVLHLDLGKFLDLRPVMTPDSHHMNLAARNLLMTSTNRFIFA
jgi:serine/threonine protein kinase